MRKKVTLFVILLFIAGFVQAQINLKIGYGAAYAKAPEINHIIEEYNVVQSSILNETVQEMHYMHGINLGVRYRWNFLATELSFESLGNRTKAVEVNGNTGYEKEFYLRLNHLSLNTEVILGTISIGAAIEKGNYKLQSKLTGSSQKKNLGNSYPTTSKVFVSFNLKGTELLGISISPYYRFHLGEKLQVGGLSNYLLGNTKNNFDNLSHFGINLCFYNGSQTN